MSYSFSHQDLWAGVEALARFLGTSPSGLARSVGLDATAFNKSKRHAGNQKRWISTETLSMILAAADMELADFAALIKSTDNLSVTFGGYAYAAHHLRYNNETLHVQRSDNGAKPSFTLTDEQRKKLQKADLRGFAPITLVGIHLSANHDVRLKQLWRRPEKNMAVHAETVEDGVLHAKRLPSQQVVGENPNLTIHLNESATTQSGYIRNLLLHSTPNKRPQVMVENVVEISRNVYAVNPPLGALRVF